jgi:hypothetical protein
MKDEGGRMKEADVGGNAPVERQSIFLRAADHPVASRHPSLKTGGEIRVHFLHLTSHLHTGHNQGRETAAHAYARVFPLLFLRRGRRAADGVVALPAYLYQANRKSEFLTGLHPPS